MLRRARQTYCIGNCMKIQELFCYTARLGKRNWLTWHCCLCYLEQAKGEPLGGGFRVVGCLNKECHVTINAIRDGNKKWMPTHRFGVLNELMD